MVEVLVDFKFEGVFDDFGFIGIISFENVDYIILVL